MTPAPPEGAAAPTGRASAAANPRSPRLRPTDLLGAFFLCALGFLLLAAVAGVVQAIVPWAWGRWLALHLAFFGGISQLVLGAAQFFAGAFLATDPPPRRLIRAQLLAWNGGALLLAVAVPLRIDLGMWIAVALLASALLLWGYSLAHLRRMSLASNPWATRWYDAAAGFFAAGIVAGGMLAAGIAWPHGNLAAAHMVLNLGGWFGSAIVGTLHTFYPTLTRVRLPFPQLQPPAFRLWATGIAALAVGYAWSFGTVATLAWFALAGAAILLLLNVVGCRLRSEIPVSLAARLVGVAQAFLPAGVVLLAVSAVADGPVLTLSGSTRAAAGTLLVAGWVGITVIGSLLHLLGVLVRSRGYRPAGSGGIPAAEPALVAFAAIGVVGLAVAQLAGANAAVIGAKAIVLVAYAILASRVAALAVGILRHARPDL